ncbi:MAG: M20 family metallopeptidase [Lachnospiraceae bacterium]|nr:M20 family metallopeptidase [Lachnospiraceae bacterium]
MNMYNEALAIKEIILENRKFLHQNPELGLDLPITSAFVEKKLKEMGYEPKRVGDCGIVATIGIEGGKCFLLRADMDGLPVKEEADVDFKSKNGNMHACGHDCHAANLLGAAKLLKDHEAELDGMVKLMFQPAEETMEGGKMMIEAGICDGVDAAMGMHVLTNIPMPVGTVFMMGTKSRMAAVDWFTIKITGKGCHGAMPHNGVDPLNVMAHIHIALQTINAREMDPADNIVLTIGQMHGGETSNVIPNEAFMSGTIRTLKNETRTMVKERMNAIVSGIAASFHAEAHVEYGSGCPVLSQNAEIYADVKAALKTLEGVKWIDMDDVGQEMTGMGSEDFSYVSNTVPSVFLQVAAGHPDEGYCYPQHHPKARFHEDALPVGAATYAHVAMEWLKSNQ